MKCTADKHWHSNHQQGNVYGSSLKIIRVANAWHVASGHDLEGDREGKHWAFETPAALHEFMEKWCAGELPPEEQP